MIKKNLGNLWEKHLDEVIRQGGDTKAFMNMLDSPEYQEYSSNLLEIQAAYDQYGTEIFNDANLVSTDEFVTPDGRTIKIADGSNSVRIKLRDNLNAANTYINSLPAEQAGLAMMSVSVITGGPIKTLVQAGKDMALDYASADAKEKLNNFVKTGIGAAFYNTDYNTYTLLSDEEKFNTIRESYNKITDHIEKYGDSQMSPEDKQRYNFVGSYVNNSVVDDVRSDMKSGAGAIDLATIIVMGVGAAALATGKKKGDGEDTDRGKGNNGGGNNPPDDRSDFTGPYDPNKTREDLEATHGAENVSSTTVPKDPHQRVNDDPSKNIEVIHGANGGKAVKVGYKDPKTGEDVSANIPYNDRGLPVFDDVSKYTTDIDMSKNYDGQMRQATRDVREGIKSGKIDKSQFTAEQLRDIQAGNKTIKGYTWHHNADSHNMQLIPKAVHDAASHVGQGSLNQGQ